MTSRRLANMAALAATVVARGNPVQTTAVIDDPLPGDPTEAPPPRRLSLRPNHKDFHPSYQRVGVRVDGVERTDLEWYDVEQRMFKRLGMYQNEHAENIEPYWRYPETRQMRRARQRWEAKHDPR